MDRLKLRRLGKTGLEVSEIGFGLWAAGGNEWGKVDDQEILSAIDRALEFGMNFYDTADVYGIGHSEELLGKAIQARRERFIIATKIGWLGFDSEQKFSAYDTVEKLIAGVESNLRRLGTDYIDIIQNHIHYRERNTDIFLEGFQKLQKDGKVRAYGASSSDFEFIQQFNQDGGCATLQIDYSILHRMPEQEIFPYCEQEDIGVIVRGPLAMGILTGKFNADTQFEAGDFRRNWQEKPDEHRVFLEDLEKVAKLRPLARGKTLTQLAIQFTLAHPVVTTVIPGIKNISQAEENISAGLMPRLEEDDLAKIDAITPPGGGRKIWPA